MRQAATVHLFMNLLARQEYETTSYATLDIDEFGNEYERKSMEMSNIPVSLLLTGLESGKTNSYNFTIQLVINDFNPEAFTGDSDDQTDGTQDQDGNEPDLDNSDGSLPGSDDQASADGSTSTDQVSNDAYYDVSMYFITEEIIPDDNPAGSDVDQDVKIDNSVPNGSNSDGSNVPAGSNSDGSDATITINADGTIVIDAGSNGSNSFGN